VSISSASGGTPTPATTDGVSLPSQGTDGSAAGGGGSSAAGVGGQQGTDNANAIVVEGEEAQDEDGQPSGKRKKKCTSDVWQYFDKKKLIIGKTSSDLGPLHFS
jgi:hypothetical protein